MRRKVIKAICSLLVVTLWGVSPVYAEETDNQQQETEKTVEEGGRNCWNRRNNTAHTIYCT